MRLLALLLLLGVAACGWTGWTPGDLERARRDASYRSWNSAPIGTFTMLTERGNPTRFWLHLTRDEHGTWVHLEFAVVNWDTSATDEPFAARVRTRNGLELEPVWRRPRDTWNMAFFDSMSGESDSWFFGPVAPASVEEVIVTVAGQEHCFRTGP